MGSCNLLTGYPTTHNGWLHDKNWCHRLRFIVVVAVIGMRETWNKIECHNVPKQNVIITPPPPPHNSSNNEIQSFDDRLILLRTSTKPNEIVVYLSKLHRLTNRNELIQLQNDWCKASLQLWRFSYTRFPYLPCEICILNRLIYSHLKTWCTCSVIGAKYYRVASCFWLGVDYISLFARRHLRIRSVCTR